MVGAEGPLGAWLKESTFRIMALEEFGLHEDDGVDLDYSGASLRGLEEFFLGYYDTPDDIRFDGLDVGDAEPVSVEGIAAYLGDTLLRLAGRGSWVWVVDADLEGFPAGVPLVQPDPTLGLDAVSPVQLMMDAVRTRDGERFTALYGEWERAVQRVKQTQPLWPAGEDLVGWLAHRSDAFPGWVATYAPVGAWDFSPDTLPALEDLVRRVTPTEAELGDPANRDFRDGAAWYQGEVMRRGMGGRWNDDYRWPPGDHVFAVEELGPSGSSSTPVIALARALDEPGFLRAHYDNFAS